MYNIVCKTHYSKNLNVESFSNRYTKLIQSNKINVIYIKDVFDNSTYRYRGYNVIQSMKESKKYYVDGFLINELNYLYDILDKVKIVVLQRVKWSFHLDSFLSILKNYNIKIIYDMDDLIYDTKYVPSYLNNIGYYDDSSIDSFYALAKRYELIFYKCNGYIASTKKLTSFIRNDIRKPVWQLNNYLNKEQIAVSKQVCSLKKQNYNSSKFVIGYFSGSNSHARDLEIAESGIIKFLKEHDNTYLNIVGYMDLSDELLELQKQGRVLFSKFVSFEELQYEIGKVDLNIIPLQKHDFNSCKSELKYFEASIVKTLTLATNNEVYSSLIDDGKDGFLANEFEWFSKLEYIYNNYSKMDSIISKACEKCHKLYDYDNQICNIETVYDKILLELGDE